MWAKWYEYVFVLVLLVATTGGFIYANKHVPKRTKLNVFDWSKK